MNDNSNQKYLNEMERNSKLFEEKMNKFKKYQKSSIYNEPDDEYLDEDEDFNNNKYSVKKRTKNYKEMQNSDDEENPHKPDSVGSHPCAGDRFLHLSVYARTSGRIGSAGDRRGHTPW